MSNEEKDRLEKEALESLVASDLSEKMKQWGGGPPSTQPQHSGRSKGWWILLLLLLPAIGIWLLTQGGRKEVPAPAPTPSDMPAPPQEKPVQAPAPGPVADTPVSGKEQRYIALAQRQYRKPDFDDGIRGAGSESPEWLLRARQALRENRYQAAIEALKEAPGAYAGDAAYLRGHALFGLKKYTEAARTFQSLQAGIRYREAAEWYGTLALLPDFERNKALILKRLNEMARDNGHAYQQNAAKLLKSL